MRAVVLLLTCLTLAACSQGSRSGSESESDGGARASTSDHTATLLAACAELKARSLLEREERRCAEMGACFDEHLEGVSADRMATYKRDPYDSYVIVLEEVGSCFDPDDDVPCGEDVPECEAFGVLCKAIDSPQELACEGAMTDVDYCARVAIGELSTMELDAPRARQVRAACERDLA